MKVLVTGHKGYIGSVLVPHLLHAGHNVRGLDGDLFERCAHGPAGVEVPSVRKDIRDAERCDLAGVDAVIHLAALCNDASGDLYPAVTHAVNAEATARLAALARDAGVSRFLFSSSCSVYGAGGDALLDENAPFRPLSHYARSKVRAEEELRRLTSGAFSTVSLRNPTLYGPSARMRFDLVVNNLVGWALAEGRVYLKSDGTAWRPIAHVADVAKAMTALLGLPRDRLHGQAVNIGGLEQNFRVRDIAAVVSEALEGCPVVHAPDAATDARCYRVNVSKWLETRPASERPVPIAAGIRELVGACRAHPVTVEAFEGPSLDRGRHLAWLVEHGHLDRHLRQPKAAVAE